MGLVFFSSEEAAEAEVDLVYCEQCRKAERSTMGTVLLIDYENVRPENLDDVAERDLSVKPFVGQSQAKVPIELVTSAQRLGSRLEWIRITGTGKNALDFHIAYWIGVLVGGGGTDCVACAVPSHAHARRGQTVGWDPGAALNVTWIVSVKWTKLLCSGSLESATRSR